MSEDPTFKCKANNSKIPLPPGTSALSMRSIDNGYFKSNDNTLLSGIFSVKKSLAVRNQTDIGGKMDKSFRLLEYSERSKTTMRSDFKNKAKKRLNVI
jgi:hypothetical protein